MALPTLTDLFQQKKSLSGINVLVRCDLNVPMQHGRIIDTTRIESAIPTIEALLAKKARVILLSHFGRPKGKFERTMSLAPITDALQSYLPKTSVKFALDCVGKLAKEAVEKLQDGDVLLLENLRFHPEEEANDTAFASELASHGQIFINDTFSCSHRAHASIVGINATLPAYAGISLQREVEGIERVWLAAKQPIVAVLGGSKVSTKIGLIESLLPKVKTLILGGGLANTFLAAQGAKIGTSLVEKEHIETAKSIITKAQKAGVALLLPQDAVVVSALEDAEVALADISSIPKDKMIVDVGPATVTAIEEVITSAQTVLWNGPLGAFEFGSNHIGSASVARIIAKQTRAGKLTSIAGGGDVLAAIKLAGLQKEFTLISTAGGAFLEWLEGKDLPGLSTLKKVKVKAA